MSRGGADRDERNRAINEQIRKEVESVSDSWDVRQYLSGGSYGEVCQAVNKHTHQRVAIKRVYKAKVGGDKEVIILNETFLAKRVYREIRLLSHFHHDNILGLVTVLRYPEAPAPLEKVYMIMECMDADLSQIIRDTRARILPDHIQYFMFQIFHGLKCLHDAGVMHRDLHPGNVLLNKENEIKICDFNLAKADGLGVNTDYVTYRWYRAPELVMQWKGYSNKIDVWSAGCIMAELLTRKPLFPGSSFFNQLDRIVEIVGTPAAHDVEHIGSQSAVQYLYRELSGIPPRPWSQVLKINDELPLDFIGKLLVFNPNTRLSVDRALHDNYFKYPNCLFDEDEMRGVTRIDAFTFNESLSDSTAIKESLAVDIERIQLRYQMSAAVQQQPVAATDGGEAPAAAAAAEEEVETDSAAAVEGSPRQGLAVRQGNMIRTNSDYNIEMIDRMLQEQEGCDADDQEGTWGDEARKDGPPLEEAAP
eukprot:Hpha_TRINITY_DN12584_c0_g2::TRINITY_DN12584_c0_g2_i1::g.50881::m.50881/K04371/MAPK1_3; mitogen-activated protein kinase 1/3